MNVSSPILPRPVGFPETSVYDTDAPDSYTDLDLSGVVGARKCIVLIKLLNKDAVSAVWYFRQNGETAVFYSGVSAHASALAQNQIMYKCVVTDASGIVEWMCNNSNIATQVWVMWFIGLA